MVTTLSQTDASESETYAISAVNDQNVWVVGSYLAGAARVGTPLALHYNGQAWSMSSASPANALVGVTATSRGVWTVGDGPNPQPPFASPSTLRWVNHAWVNKPLPRSYDFGRLNAVTTAPDGRVWAAGFDIGNSGDATKILHR